MNKTQFKKIVGEILKSQSFAYENKYYTFENTDLKVFVDFQKSRSATYLIKSLFLYSQDLSNCISNIIFVLSQL